MRSGPAFDILIASRNRPARLRRLLESLEGERDQLERVLVLANGLDRRVRRPYQDLAHAHPEVEFVELDAPGKARALNAGLERSDAEWIGFLDDDVRVMPGWAQAYKQAAASGGQCFQGRIRFAPNIYADAGAMALYQTFRMLPHVDPPADGSSRRALVGANFMVSRQALRSVGGFDERLGPGASGLDEDTDVSRRLRKLGQTIRYVQGAAVEHHFCSRRLTPEGRDRYCASLGRGRAIMRPDRSRLSTLGQALLWGARECAAAACLLERQRVHSRSKRLIYQEMLAFLRSTPMQGSRDFLTRFQGTCWDRELVRRE